jgi:acyl-CoA thioester hydrolase
MTSTKRATICDTDRSFYKHWTSVNLRYGDTDRQGHVNNAVFCTLLESGRVDFLFDKEVPICGTGKSWVIARLSLDYLAELNFPGIVEVGSRVLSMGNSSFTVGQALFVDMKCCSTAESIIVLTDEQTKKSSALTPEIKRILERIS